MKLTKLFAATAGVLMISCSTLTNMASLLTCNYNVQGIGDPRLAGISLTSTSDLTKLDATTALKVTTALLAKTLPLSMTVNLGVTNPNSTAAEIEGLDWALFFQEKNMLTGSTAQRVHVDANGGKTTVPFVVQLDLASLFEKESRDQMMQFANGLLHVGEQNSGVSLKIRPKVAFGGQVYTPNYITVLK